MGSEAEQDERNPWQPRDMTQSKRLHGDRRDHDSHQWRRCDDLAKRNLFTHVNPTSLLVFFFFGNRPGQQRYLSEMIVERFEAKVGATSTR